MGGNRIEVMLDYGAYAPERAYRADAGLDLRSPITVRIDPGKAAVINTGVHMAIPEGYVGMLKSKSGLNIKLGLLSEGVIDAGYTGPIHVKLYNHGKNPVLIEDGDKISQIVILPIITPEVDFVDHLGETERGACGLGSTGR